MRSADIEARIATLKAALTLEGMKHAVFDPTKLVETTPRLALAPNTLGISETLRDKYPQLP